MSETTIGRTALVVPVPEADQAIGDWRHRYTEGGRRGMDSHVTLVSPWLQAEAITDATLETLAACVRGVRAFRFALTRVERFPQGVLYLSVDPIERFTVLIQAVCDAFPTHQPYGGEFAPRDVTPHVTVAVAAGYPDGATADDLRVFRQASTAVGASVPIDAVARELHVCEETDEGWHVAHRVRLGSVRGDGGR